MRYSRRAGWQLVVKLRCGCKSATCQAKITMTMSISYFTKPQIIIIIIIIIKGRPLLEHIAASTVHRYCSRSWARLHAVCRPMLSALRSFSMVRVHDCLGGPEGRLQWLGNPEITARSALEWSIRASDLATCPKSRRRLLHRTVESCVWLVRLSTSVLVTCWRCEMRRSILKHHCWHALSFFSSTRRWLTMSWLHGTVESCVWLVRLSTSVLVTCWRCEMRRSLLKHHRWQALSFFSSKEVTDHVLAPQSRTGRTYTFRRCIYFVSNRMLERQMLFCRAWKQSLVIAIRRLTSCSLLPSLDICTPRYVKLTKTTITGDNERKWKWQPEIERLEYSNSKNNWNSLLVITYSFTHGSPDYHSSRFNHFLWLWATMSPASISETSQCKRVVGGHKITTSVRSEESI